jgi:hypothetical protein
MQHLYKILILILVGSQLVAQTAWIEPTPIDPEEEITIYVDINKTSCPELASIGQDLYMWTWKPNELPDGDELANGTWDDSNEAMKMTDEGGGVYSYTLVPTEFYKVSGDAVFEEGFCLLVKADDGAGGATSCSEDKTEDLCVEVEPPVLFRPKIYSIPQRIIEDTIPTSADDIFTLVYDHKLEEKQALVDANTFYVFAKGIGTDNKEYLVATPNQLSNTPSLKMEERGNDKHYWTVVPERIFKDLLPDGVELSALDLRVAKEGASSGGDLADGTFRYYFNCK